MSTLYRKYRPQSFAEVVGQESVKQILLSEITSGRLAHAYLFSGPRGTGKTTLARLLAKALNCSARAKSGEPCGECQSCQSIAAGRSQDLVEMDAASNRRIEEIRELREHVKYVPASAPYKVYIIDEAHMLTDAAFNAFLKTLEEPPAHTIFILATTELRKIPDTIFSRCQHFAFKKLSLAQIMERLQVIAAAEGVEIDNEVLEAVARRANGAARDAEGLLGQIIATGKKKITAAEAALFLPKVGFSRAFGWLSHLAAGRAGQALRALQSLEEEGVNLEFFLQESLEFSRQIFLYQATGDQDNLELHFSPDEINDIQDLIKGMSLTRLRTILIELLRASQDMKLSPDLPILAIELAVVAICEKEKESAAVNRAATSDSPADSPVIPHASLRTGLERRPPQAAEAIESQDSIGRSPYRPADSGARSFQNDKYDIAGPLPKSNHTLDDILAGWGEVMARVRDKNQALNFMLSVARPVAVRRDAVELAFKYRLQLERAGEHKNQMIVEQAMSEVFGAKFRLSAKLEEDIKIGAEESISSKPLAPAAAAISDEELLTRAAMQVFEGAVAEN